MTAIHGDRVDASAATAMASLRRDEDAGTAHVGDRAAGFHPAQHIPACAVLVFERDSGRAIDASLLKRLEHFAGKRQSVKEVSRYDGGRAPSLIKSSYSLLHCRSSADRLPNAARISSFVQPAQHL